MRQVSQDFRKSFLRLLGHKEKRESFFGTAYSEVYNRRFSRCLVQRAASFLTELEKGLPDTFLDELLRGDWTENQPVNTPTLWDVLMEVLLEAVEGKTTLRSADLLSLLKDLHSVSAPHQQDIRHGAKCIRLLCASSDDLSASSGSQSSHNSNRTLADSSSAMPHHRVEGRLDQGRVADCDTSHLTDKTSASSKTGSDDPDNSRTCQGCQQSRRIRLSAVRPHRYCGQHGTYVAPACHVRLTYGQTYQDSSGVQHPLFI